MQHLTPERLAELADDIPGTDEARHLVACELCAREVQSFRRLGGMAAQMSASESHLPLTDWITLAPRLEAEGLLRRGQPERTMRASLWLMRIAAGLLLFLTGALSGRWLAQSESGAVTGSVAQNGQVAREFGSVEEARDVLARAERDYQLAAAYLAGYAGAGESVDPDLIRTRLAALDAVAGVVRDAIDQAPFDPVINQYYISTLEARQATLHQLATALPPGVQISSF